MNREEEIKKMAIEISTYCREYCREYGECDNCIFESTGVFDCILNRTPYEWKFNLTGEPTL